MATFTDSFDDSVPQTESNRPFDDEYDNGGYVGYESQQFAEPDGVFESEEQTPPPIYSAGVELSTEENGGVFGGSDSPILPPPSEMKEEGFALREWRRLEWHLHGRPTVCGVDPLSSSSSSSS